MFLISRTKQGKNLMVSITKTILHHRQQAKRGNQRPRVNDMTNGTWSRSDKMSLAALLIGSLSLVASVSLIIVFCVLWLRSPVDMETDQTSKTQPPDNATTEDAKSGQMPTFQTTSPEKPTSKTKTDQKQLQAKTKAEYDAYN